MFMQPDALYVNFLCIELHKRNLCYLMNIAAQVYECVTIFI